MKNEIDWACVLIAGLFAAITICIVCAIVADHRETMAALERGYVQQQAIGSSQLLWVKAK